MILEDQRDLFDLAPEVTYLNCAYLGPQLRAVREAGERAISSRSKPWEITPEDFFTHSERGRGLFAQLVGGEPDGVALVPSASYGVAVAAANVEVKERNNILVLEEQFPSNYYSWSDLARERGARLAVVKRLEDGDWTRAVLERLDESTAVVAVPNCHWTDGSVVDLAAVGERAREVGAALVVDATQSLGAMPFDVSEVRPDFLVAAGYKWLLGPYGSGFLYVGEGFREGCPVERNWINRSASEDFARLVDYTEGFQPGARRYDAGGRAATILLPMANAALEQILAWGVENVAETLGRLTDLVEEKAKERGLETLPKERRSRHLTGLKLGPGAPDDLPERLARENVFVSARGSSLRVSPHLCNDAEDVERLFEVLDTVGGVKYPK